MMDDDYKFGVDEIDQVLRQPSHVRYEYFLKRVADWERVWSLKGADGWVMSADPEGHQVAPFWPFKAYAERCASANWQTAVPASIEMDAFLSRWLPGLQKDGRRVAVFPDLQKQAAVVDPLALKQAIEREMEQLE